MNNGDNKKIMKNRMKLVVITWCIILPLMIGIILYNIYSGDKKESLICSKKQSGIEMTITYNYIGGYFSSGNMKVIVDNSSPNEMNWCEFMSEQSKELFISKSCNEESGDNKKTINMNIGFDSSIDRKNVKIKDDKQKIEELGFSCNME